MLEKLVCRPLRLEEEMSDVWCSCTNFMKGGFGMVGEAGEAYAFEAWKVDRGRSYCRHGGETIEEGKLDEIWHGNGEQDGGACDRGAEIKCSDCGRSKLEDTKEGITGISLWRSRSGWLQER